MFKYKIFYKDPQGKTRTILADYIELDESTGDIRFAIKEVPHAQYCIPNNKIIEIKVHKL